MSSEENHPVDHHLSVFRRAGAVFGFLGVAIGAMGGHAWEDLLLSHDRLGTWETASFYHLVHALALFALPAVVARGTLQSWAGGLFAAGILLFSGSLYILSLTNLTWLGAITPFGGLAFLGGWICAAFGRSHPQAS